MHPILFTLPGGLTIKTYGFCMMVGFLTGVWFAMKRAARVKADPDAVLNLGFFALLGGVGGARLFYVVHYWRRQFADLTNPWLAALDIREGGLEFLGGFLGATLVIILYLLITRRSIRMYLDILTPSVMWGLGCGRIGCFFNGCCFGGLCLLPGAAEPTPQYAWAVRFPYHSPAQHDQWEKRQVTVPAELLFTSKELLQPVPISDQALNMSVERRERPQRRAEAAAQTLREAKASGADEAQLEALARQARAAREAAEAHIRTNALAVMYKAQDYPSRRKPTRAQGTSISELQDLAAQARSLPVHPVQLYSSINGFLLCGVLTAMFYVRKRHGVVIASLFVLYPVARFFLEIIRTDNPHEAAGLTASQFVSLGMFLTGIVALMVLYRFMPERSKYAVPFVPPPSEKDAGD